MGPRRPPSPSSRWTRSGTARRPGTSVQVADLPSVAGRTLEWPSADDEPPTDTDFAVDVQHVVDSHGSTAAMLGEHAQVGFVGDKARARPGRGARRGGFPVARGSSPGWAQSRQGHRGSGPPRPRQRRRRRAGRGWGGRLSARPTGRRGHRRSGRRCYALAADPCASGRGRCRRGRPRPRRRCRHPGRTRPRSQPRARG